jgi:Spy/CpxP family protein refolding chaperone
MAQRVLLGVIGLMLAGMAAASGALAQPGGEYGGGFQNKFMEVKRTQLGPALGVDQRTVDNLLQLEQRYKPLRQQLIMQSKTEFQRLQQAINQPSPPDQEVRTILGNMKRLQKEMEELKHRQDEEEMTMLTPVQQARYILYLRTLVKEARNIRGGPGGGPGGGAPLTPQNPREIPVSRPSQ